MSTTRLRKSNLFDDDQVLGLITAALAELPERDRNEIHAFLDFWRALPGAERALFAKSVGADLIGEQIARLTGTRTREVYCQEKSIGSRCGRSRIPRPIPPHDSRRKSGPKPGAVNF
jgi:hypothetical protein